MPLKHGIKDSLKKWRHTFAILVKKKQIYDNKN